MIMVKKILIVCIVLGISGIATGLISCSSRLDSKQTLERFLSAYKNEQWDICDSLGTRKTKATISLIKNIIANFNEKELVIYNSQKLNQFQVQTMQESGDRAASAISVNNGTQITVNLLRDSDKWLVNLEKPIP